MSKHLEVEMDHLKRNLLSLSSLVEDVVQKAVRSLEERDRELAKIVIKTDTEVDNLEVEIEEDCLKILALHQPVAVDLRYLVGVLKVNNDLERIGDIAVNIAERTLFVTKRPEIDKPIFLDEMAEKTYSMLKRSIDALINMDTELAKKVCFDDQEVDSMNKEMYSVIFAAIQEKPKDVQSLISYLAASRHLERIADYATNIAEDVIYMVEGTIVRHSPELYES
jgi:phosphate transport system protein